MYERSGWAWRPYAETLRPQDQSRAGAGCMIFARRTGRFLFCLRPEESPSGGTWSPWGGKSEARETARDTALREVLEETGLTYDGDLQHLYHSESRTFAYDTFLMVVDDEFEPRSSPEWQACLWVPLEEAPEPMHWGLRELLEDRTAASLLVKAVSNLSGRPCKLLAAAE